MSENLNSVGRDNGHRDEEEGHVHYHGVDKAEEHIKVDLALGKLLAEIAPVRPETISLDGAWNRVLFHDITSHSYVPKMARSTRDGFAVRLPKTRAAEMTKTSPLEFSIVGEVRIGTIPEISLKKDWEAAIVATGSYVPEGTSAVVMKEYAIRLGANMLSVGRTIRERENILPPGADIERGDTLLRAGTRLHPTHIALLSMLGVWKVKVYRRPRVAFFSTGDELLDLGQSTRENSKRGDKDPRKENKDSGARIFDSTRPFVRSALEELGVEPCDLGIARDNFTEIKAKMLNGLQAYDALFLSAGSSVGERDYVGRAADAIRGVRMLVHGVAMRPSSPTGLAVYHGKPFILLPGFPTSAIVSFFVFGLAAIGKLSGLALHAEEHAGSLVETLGLVHPVTYATLLDEYHTQKAGITHFLRVHVSRERKVKNGRTRFIAQIVKPTEAYYSRWLSEANGIAVIEGGRYSTKGEKEVPVLLFGRV